MTTRKIKEYLAEHGIKIGFIAGKIGMNENTLSMKLNGKSKMSVDEFIAICDVLNVSCDEFRKKITA